MNNLTLKNTIRDFCEQLEIAMPLLFDNYTLVDPGAKPNDSIRSNVYRNFNAGRQDFTLGQMTDLTRCTTIMEDYQEMPKYIGKLRKLDPSLHGAIKRNERSGYIGIHLQTLTEGIPSEIQLQTPFGFQVKKIADENYQKTRLFASLSEKLKVGTLSAPELKELEWRQKDYARRCEMERELFSLIHSNTNIDANLERIEAMLANLGEGEERKRFFTYPYESALAQPLSGRHGLVSSQKLTRTINTLAPYLPTAQSHLCGETISPIQNAHISKC